MATNNEPGITWRESITASVQDALRLGCAAAVAGPAYADVVLRRLPASLSDLTDLTGLAV